MDLLSDKNCATIESGQNMRVDMGTHDVVLDRAGKGLEHLADLVDEIAARR